MKLDLSLLQAGYSALEREVWFIKAQDPWVSTRNPRWNTNLEETNLVNKSFVSQAEVVYTRETSMQPDLHG